MQQELIEMKKKVEQSDRQAAVAKGMIGELEKKNYELDKENNRLKELIVTIKKERLDEESKLLE